MATSLLLVVLVAGAFSLPALYSRFYANAMPLAPEAETLADIRAVRHGSELRFTGYAVDLRNASPVTQTVLRLDNASVVPTRQVDHPSLECDMEKTLLPAGFTAAIDRRDLASGPHEVAVFVKVPWTSKLLDTGVAARFTINVPTVAGSKRLQ